ncbi:MAG: hypothetical protein PHV74_08465 [Dehalococcoidia bacterium]|nr:hypothetical protein [Dehalococcoidia bacterium]
MKSFSKLGVLLVVVILVLMMVMPVFADGYNDDSFSPEAINGYAVPKDIGGLPVIFVHTAENTRGMQAGEVRIVVQDTAGTLDESLEKATVSKYLTAHPLPQGWLVFVVGGPNTSRSEYEKRNTEINKFCDKHGSLPKLGPSSSTNGKSVAVQQQWAAHHAYAVDQNLDPGTMTIVNQNVRWTAPQVGNNQNAYSALMDNGWTDNNAFLQVGQVYFQGAGQNGYAVSPTCEFVPFPNVPYVVGHPYLFTMYYSSSHWQLSVLDYQTSAFQYVNCSGAGSRLVLSDDTGVFFENVNTNANWYTGFTNPINVPLAVDRGFECWGSDSIFQIYTAGGHLPINDAITGHLAQCNTASFHLDKILLAY